MAAPLLSAGTARIIIPATLMQPTPELTVQERPVISPRLCNVSRATIKNTVYFVGGIFYYRWCVLVRGIYIKMFLRRPQIHAVFLH